MTEQFVGYTVSLEVGGGLGFYQGVVKNVNSANQMITLGKVLHNGKLTNKDVTFNAADIIDLKILKYGDNTKVAQSSEQKTPTSLMPKSGLEVKSTDHTGCYKSEGNKTPSQYTPIKNESSLVTHKNNQCSYNNIASPKKQTNVPQAFQPIEPPFIDKKDHNLASPSKALQPRRKSRTSVLENFHDGSFNEVASKNPAFFSHSSTGAYQRKPIEQNSLAGNRRQWNRQHKINIRDETTFGTPIDDDVMNTEFDFEKNLALFDKQAVIDEIEFSRPDVVRQIETKSDAKYGCKENVLPSKANSKRQIFVPASESGEVVYVTDSGLIVPSISKELRMNLLSTANQSGHTMSRQLEMMGRAATEVIISVIGGSRRLEPHNSHQSPVVVILCGVNMQGAAGMNCGRQLESQGVETVVVTPALPASVTPSHLLAQESHLFSLSSGRLTNDIKTLPSKVDLILDARFDHSGSLGVTETTWLSEINAWVTASRAVLIALDPPCQLPLSLPTKIRLCPALPLAHPPGKGQVYLMNLCIPQQVFISLGIKYTTPFGAKMAVPLHAFE